MSSKVYSIDYNASLRSKRKQSPRVWLTGFDMVYLACGLLCLVPIFFKKFQLDDSELALSLQNISVKMSFVGSFSLGFPVVVDLFLDLFSNIPLKNLVSRVVILVSFVIPSIIYLIESPAFNVPNAFLYLSCYFFFI